VHYGGGTACRWGIPRGGRPLTRSEGDPVRSAELPNGGDSSSQATGAAASVGLLATAADGGAGPQAPAMDTPPPTRAAGAYIFSAPMLASGSAADFEPLVLAARFSALRICSRSLI
jgi:hypothetical protein